MTGKHQGHALVRGNRNPEVALRPEDVTVAEVLKRAGYTTALYGKWGVGGPVTSGRPNLKGFDDFFGYLSQWHAHAYYLEHLWENEIERFIRGNLGRRQGEYSHDLFTDRALKFLGRKHDKPFFLYLPYTIPQDGALDADSPHGVEGVSAEGLTSRAAAVRRREIWATSGCYTPNSGRAPSVQGFLPPSERNTKKLPRHGRRT